MHGGGGDKAGQKGGVLKWRVPWLTPICMLDWPAQTNTSPTTTSSTTIERTSVGSALDIAVALTLAPRALGSSGSSSTRHSPLDPHGTSRCVWPSPTT